SMKEKQKNGGRVSSRAETGDVLMLSDFTIKAAGREIPPAGGVYSAPYLIKVVHRRFFQAMR
ncbi:MAG: hypothetical protein FWF96_03390, partial [Kiritimatiellaeota bacterium]|nr:hypothetical protein [Kiritimatiellota bacterium]